MRVITINLPDIYLNGIEKLVQEDIYPNRSEAIRTAVRDFILKETHKDDMKKPKFFKWI